ncbi:MAG: peptidylprolyl isomerase [Phycisphaerae bacterium]|nr:peptidylprolyl isomerase [Phycisphaerae bacterium]
MNVAKAIGALDRTSRGEFGRLPTTSVSVNDPDLAITDYLDPDDPDDPQEPETVRVWLETTMGEIILEVLVSEAPVTAANFLEYVDSGFYDGTIFHRVIPGFVVQGGGFQPGLVTREGVRDPIINEFSPQRSNVRGTLAMAKRGDDPDSATSQFFFNLVDNSGNLDNQNGGFTVFARVVAGMEVVDAMAAAETTTKTTSEGNAIDDVPVTEIVLITAARL